MDSTERNSFVDNNGYVWASDPSHPKAHNGYVYEHRLVVERALGRALPPGAVVHHVNGDKADNRPANLVVCESESYHRTLHRRQRAFDASGNPDWPVCNYCGEYDDPNNMWVNPKGRQRWHQECRNRYRRKRSWQ